MSFCNWAEAYYILVSVIQYVCIQWLFVNASIWDYKVIFICRLLTYLCGILTWLPKLVPLRRCQQVNYTELGEICNLWRNYGDIQDSWDDVVNIIEWWAKNQDVLVPAAGPGRWNDPDMLIAGDYSLSVDQSKAQFGKRIFAARALLCSSAQVRLVTRNFPKTQLFQTFL